MFVTALTLSLLAPVWYRQAPPKTADFVVPIQMEFGGEINFGKGDPPPEVIERPVIRPDLIPDEPENKKRKKKRQPVIEQASCTDRSIEAAIAKISKQGERRIAQTTGMRTHTKISIDTLTAAREYYAKIASSCGRNDLRDVVRQLDQQLTLLRRRLQQL